MGRRRALREVAHVPIRQLHSGAVAPDLVGPPASSVSVRPASTDLRLRACGPQPRGEDAAEPYDFSNSKLERIFLTLTF